MKHPIDIDSIRKNQNDLENIINDINNGLSDDDRERLKNLLDAEKNSLQNLEKFYKQSDKKI